jgi:hypothetical protein
MSKNIAKDHISEYILKRIKIRLLNRLNKLEKERESIKLKDCAIQSDKIQEIGYSDYELNLRREEIYKESDALDEKEFKLKNHLLEIEKKLCRLNQTRKKISNV